MIVVDTSALLALLNTEPERDRFLDVLANDDRVVVSAVTLYETMLVAGTRRGPDNLSDLAQILDTVDAEIVPFDADQAYAAQAVYMRYGCPSQSMRLRRLLSGEAARRPLALQGRRLRRHRHRQSVSRFLRD